MEECLIEMNKEREVHIMSKIITEAEQTKACSRISITVMIVNLFLSILYLITGWIGHSIAALSEGVDSLTDAGSSLLLLLGFKISARKPDSLHPNGHKRMEYIIGLLISEIMLTASISLMKQSIYALRNPVIYSTSIVLMAASGIAGLGKLLIGSYIKKQNKEYQSSSLKVYYKNTMDDLKGIILVAFATITQPYTTLPVDAIVGIILALMIGFDGLKSFFENVSLILGEEKDLKKENQSYANE